MENNPAQFSLAQLSNILELDQAKNISPAFGERGWLGRSWKYQGSVHISHNQLLMKYVVQFI